ncbi:hypothetical protein TNCV_2896671 [Trichonephila clavipes]|nr:hypothetical protein TNCV_2896671 [Trichonephila clavipes]
MVTEYEKWVTYDNNVRKRSWSKRGEAAQMVARPGLKPGSLILSTENTQHKKSPILHVDEDKEAKKADFPESRYSYKAANGRTPHVISVDGACLLVERYRSKDSRSDPSEGMDVCKCIVSSWKGDTRNSRRVASPFVRLQEEERGEAPAHPQGVLSQNWGKNDPNPTLACMVNLPS